MRLCGAALGRGLNPGEAPAPILSMRFRGLCFLLYLCLPSSLALYLDSFLCFFSFLNSPPSLHTTTRSSWGLCVCMCLSLLLLVALFLCALRPSLFL